MSSFDVLASVGELKELKGARINKVFQISATELRIPLNLPGVGRKDLVIEAGRRIHLTEYPKPGPKEASTFAMTLRKYLANSVIEGIEQVSFDRIVEIKCRRKEVYYLVAELFGRGNIILTNEERGIITLRKVERHKDRMLLPKQKYEYPPQQPNPFRLSKEEFGEVIKSSKVDLVRTLARTLGLGGLYAEEVCLKSGLDKNKTEVTDEELSSIYQAISELRGALEEDKARIILEGDEAIDVAPVKLRYYSDWKQEEFDSFNMALDAYFSRRGEKGLEATTEETFKAKLGKLNARLKEQEETIERYADIGRRYKAYGDLIYTHFQEVEGALNAISRARARMSWDEIKAKAEPEIPELEIVKKVMPGEGAILVHLGDYEVRLDIRKSAAENANFYYTKGKKAKEKIKGAEKARDNTLKQMQSIREEGEKAIESLEKPKKRAPRKTRWYEKFRWFYSSDGILVLGGRDATSNEVLVKKHMQEGDVFVHAEIHGAPASVIKAEGTAVPESTIQEAFDFAASYSKAWKHGVAGLKVYWVKPGQVSKTTEHGEYVSKGAFIVRGKRNYGNGTTKISIGVKINDEATVVGGPPSAVSKQARYHVGIVPGRKKSKEIAAGIKESLLKSAKEEDKEKILAITFEDIQRFLPPGGSDLSLRLNSRAL